MEHPTLAGPLAAQSELRVEVTALRAHNLPHIKRWLSMKRRFFVTVSYQATTMKSASVKIDGQKVEWSEKLDAFFVRPSSRLTLRLYAKRFLHRDILIGTHEIRVPVGSTSDQSFNLSEGNNRRAGESTLPVTLHLTITVSANPTPSPGLPINTTNPTAARADNPTTGNADVYPMAQGIPGTAGAVSTKPLLSLTDRNFVGSKPAMGTRAHQSVPSTPIATEHETTIDDIIKEVKRFRILSIGRSGVGKSTLINSIFGIDAARVEDYKPGEADIQQEFTSPNNQFFVLHDSKGFEPGDLTNFEIVRKFVQQRSRQELPLSERIHGLWLCTETPTAGGRVFEKGDEELLQFAHEKQVPIVVVFTQYDRLERTKELVLRKADPTMDSTRLREQSVVEAQKAFDICLQLLQLSMNHLEIPMPRYARVSVRPGHQEDVSSLVNVTKDIVQERVKGDAWAMWAIAQRANLPLKIDTCLTKGTSYYRQALMGSMPGLGQLLLRNCLENVHKDIITCWNFKGEVLNSPKFQLQMLRLVHDVHTEPNVSIPPDDDDAINQYVTPVAILGSVDIFVQWLSTTVLENVPSVQRVLIAYTVDLVNVLVELFGITLRPEFAFMTTWTEVQAAFEAYEGSPSRQRIRESICSKTTQDDEKIPTPDGISRKLRDLLQERIERPLSK
ncbi:hypothetical protein EDB83DRAFT_2671669 [Lactarius deliciosus]|nr:hypothetical protein EDB83DRAFT_2671669 [Lactarius deliciosus]